MASRATEATKSSKKTSSSSKKATKDKDKKHDKSSSSNSKRDKSKSSSKDKDKDTHGKKSASSSSSDSKSKTKSRTPEAAAADATSEPTVTVAAPQPSPPPAPTPTPPNDPDAVQLFRRYDRMRTGALTRLDFLQLLTDYARPLAVPPNASHPHRRAAATRARQPLSLTDSQAVPLGYARTERNSEFEAGQLFERYDSDRAGALSLATFYRFFADFRPQLTAFVEDLDDVAVSAAAAAPPQPTTTSSHSIDSTATSASRAQLLLPTNDATAAALPTRTELRAQYQTALWKLRKLCKHELLVQRERIVAWMTSIRDAIAHQQQRIPSSHSAQWQHRAPITALSSSNNNSANDAVVQYEALERDLETIDAIHAFVQQSLQADSSNASRSEILALAQQTREMTARAHNIAMHDYRATLEDATACKNVDTERPPEPTSPVYNSNIESRAVATAAADSRTPNTSTDHAAVTQLLRVKDQMIYELLRERTALRKHHAATEAALHELSAVSTAEMKKWARLTDAMQCEIERLRRSTR